MAAAGRVAWRWPLAVLVFCLVLTVLLYATRGWIWLAVPPIGDARVPFSDAAALLTAGDVCAQGVGDWHGDVCFLPSIDAPTMGQSYPPWIAFSRSGLTAQHYFAVAVVLVLLFYAAIVWLFRPRDAKQAGLLLVLVFTPAIQFCVERANFDLLMVSLLVLAAWCASRERFAGHVCASAVLAFATVLKLYTGLALTLAFLARRTLSLRAVAVSALATLATVAWFGPANFRALGRGALQGQTSFSTGAHWLANHYGAFAVVAAAVLALVVGVRAWTAFGALGAFARSSADNRLRANACVLSSVTAVPLFLMKDSFDYRFVLWLPALALPVAWLCADADARARRVLRLLLGCFLVATCSELVVRPLSLHVGAFAGKGAILDAVLLAKQFSAWIVAAIMVAATVRVIDPLRAGLRWRIARSREPARARSPSA